MKNSGKIARSLIIEIETISTNTTIGISNLTGPDPTSLFQENSRKPQATDRLGDLTLGDFTNFLAGEIGPIKTSILQLRSSIENLAKSTEIHFGSIDG